jgi:P4 family phage/plasmid primase-like protien
MLEPLITTPAVDGGTLPASMLALRYVPWTTTKVKPGSKYDKVPVTTDGHFCKGELSSHGRTFHDVVTEVFGLTAQTPATRPWSELDGKKAGVGLVMTGDPVAVADDGTPLYLAGFDWDRCFTDGELDAKVQAEIVALGGYGRLYIEKSVSGTGLRGFALTRERLRNQNLGHFECYSHSRMLTVTGQNGVGVLGLVEMEAVHALIGRNGKTNRPYLSQPILTGGASTAGLLNEDLTAHVCYPPLPPLEVLLGYVPSAKADGCTRDLWRNVIWAAMSGYGRSDETRAKLISWSELAPGEFDLSEFEGIWNHHGKNPDGVGVGTLIQAASRNGYLHAQQCGQGGLGDAALATEKTSARSPTVVPLEGDIANGWEFARCHRDKLIHVNETAEWFEFSAAYGWQAANVSAIDLAAKFVAGKLMADALLELQAHPERQGRSKLLARAQKSHNLASLRAMIEMAKSESGMHCSANQFDNDPMLLGVLNGVVDLKRGGLLAFSPAVHVSMRCNVAYMPEASCSRFEDYLHQVVPDSDVRLFLQRWFGYCLTGLSTEKKFLMLLGVGDNGKSILIELFNWLLGSYARKIETEMLMAHQRSPQAASPDIVALKGRRLVYANETSEGQRLADARVKDLTGGDTLTGRLPYGKASVSFSPSHKLMLVGNHKPVITDTSSGMWGRVVLIPFDVVIPPDQRDRQLLQKLQQEGPGILNWALSGLADYRRNALCVPPSLDTVTKAYREEQDMVGEWVVDHCLRASELKSKSTDAYRAFKRWCYENGHGQPSKTTLTRRLGASHIKQSPCRKYYLGIELNRDGVSAASRL